MADQLKAAQTALAKLDRKKLKAWRDASVWILETGMRTFVGWFLLDHYNGYITTLTALYMLFTAGVIVVMHFVQANHLNP